MAGGTKKDRVVLYLVITIVFLFFWVHTDLARYPGKFTVSLLNSLWQVVYVIALNFLYFEYALPFVTSRKTNRFIIILSSVILHLVIFMIGLYAWRALGMLINIYHPFRVYTSTGDAIAAAVTFTPGSFILFPCSPG